MQAFSAYLRRIFEEKRMNPKDDLISALVRTEEAGERLSEEEQLEEMRDLYACRDEELSGAPERWQEIRKVRNDPL